jgi:hypothetical protein
MKEFISFWKSGLTPGINKYFRLHRFSDTGQCSAAVDTPTPHLGGIQFKNRMAGKKKGKEERKQRRERGNRGRNEEIKGKQGG